MACTIALCHLARTARQYATLLFIEFVECKTRHSTENPKADVCQSLRDSSFGPHRSVVNVASVAQILEKLFLVFPARHCYFKGHRSRFRMVVQNKGLWRSLTESRYQSSPLPSSSRHPTLNLRTSSYLDTMPWCLAFADHTLAHYRSVEIIYTRNKSPLSLMCRTSSHRIDVWRCEK